jgi:hypothetical protein
MPRATSRRSDSVRAIVFNQAYKVIRAFALQPVHCI